MELSIRNVSGEHIAIPAQARERRRGDGPAFTLGDPDCGEREPAHPGAEHAHGEIAPPDEGEAGRRLDVSA